MRWVTAIACVYGRPEKERGREGLEARAAQMDRKETNRPNDKVAKVSSANSARH